MTDYDKIEQIKKTIEGVLTALGVEAHVEYEDSITKGLVFNITSQYDSYLLIGRQGATLHSLETLVHALVAKNSTRQSPEQEPVFYSIDVDDYKLKREWFLKESAKGAVDQIKKTGRNVALEPMPNYERKFVHAYLQEHFPEVYTESIGEEPYRKIIIKLKAQ
jgi:spoIIIJ-associated protein